MTQSQKSAQFLSCKGAGLGSEKLHLLRYWKPPFSKHIALLIQMSFVAIGDFYFQPELKQFQNKTFF